MALTDLFTPETKTELNFTQFHGLTKEAAKYDLLMNGIKCDVPHVFLREVMTGKKEDGIQVTGITCQMPKNFSEILEATRKERQQIAGQQDSGTRSAAGQQAQEEEGVHVGEVKLYERKQRRQNWADIKKYIQEDRAEKILTRGTELHFALKDGRPAKAVVIGINHYNQRDAVFRLVEPLTFAGMNKEHTNAGGWDKCDARRLLNEEIFPLFPDELQAVIAKHTTTQKMDGETVTSEDLQMGQYLFGCITPDREDKRQNGQRFSEGEKFYTLTTRDKHGILIDGYIRKLTPIECERLQTLPDNYTAGVSDAQRYKTLGNGWTVEVITHILKSLPAGTEA